MIFNTAKLYTNTNQLFINFIDYYKILRKHLFKNHLKLLIIKWLTYIIYILLKIYYIF